jgi:hypothetical protein
MRYIMIAILFFTIGLKMAIGTNGLIHELKDIKQVNETSIHQLPNVFKKTAESLAKEWNDDIMQEFARIYQLSLKVDSNYFYLESFYPLLQKKDAGAKMNDFMKKKLSPDEFSIYQDNVTLVKREQDEGNG